MDPRVRVSDLLRKALVVATKLQVADLATWAQQELDGYHGRKGTPAYRRVRGDVRAFNPYNGWIPVILRDKQLRELLESRDAAQPIGALEDLYLGADRGLTLQMPLPQDLLIKVFGDTEEFELGIIPTLLIGRTALRSILDAVRNEVLRWTLELEKRGVRGEGMSFTAEEKAQAAAITYNIGAFSGILGDVSAEQIHVCDYSAIHAQLKTAGVPQKARNELENLLDNMKETSPDEKKGLVARGMEWLAKYGSTIGTLSDTIRGWFDTMRSA